MHVWNTIGELGQLQFESVVYTVDEDGGNATIKVTRQNGSTGEVTVKFTTSDGTALAGVDYVTTEGTLTFANGDSNAKTITIPVKNDALLEGSETIVLYLQP